MKLMESVNLFLAEGARTPLHESLFVSYIAARYSNGDLEGFAGTSLQNGEKALAQAQKKAQRRAKILKQGDAKILSEREFATLTHKQRTKLEKDWKVSKQMDEGKSMSGKLVESKEQVEKVTQKFGEKSEEGRLARTIFECSKALPDVAFESRARVGAGVFKRVSEFLGEAKKGPAKHSLTKMLQLTATVSKAALMDDTPRTAIEDALNDLGLGSISKKQFREAMAIIRQPRQGGFSPKPLAVLRKIYDDAEIRRALENNKWEDSAIEKTLGESKAPVAGKAPLSEGTMPSADVDQIHDIFANAFAVALAEIESTTGQEFQSPNDALKFIQKYGRSLMTSGRPMLDRAVRRFDRVGAGRFLTNFRRELGGLGR